MTNQPNINQWIQQQLGTASWPSSGANWGGGGTVDKSYAGFDLAVGEVYGLRMWLMDDYGRLRARNLHKSPPWRPGVNVAQCLAEKQATQLNRVPIDEELSLVIDATGQKRKAVDVEHRFDTEDFGQAQGIASLRVRTNSRYVITWDDGSTSTSTYVPILCTHQVPDESCQCGFYAYSDPKHEEVDTYAGDHTILGVIKGTGRTLIGTRGFRTEKAEIVALRDPTRGGAKAARWRREQKERLERVYPDVPLLESRSALLDFAPIRPDLPEPTTDEFWSMP